MRGRRIRVLVVDDSPAFRGALQALLEGPAIEVVGTSSDGEDAVAKALELRPDVVTLAKGLGGGLPIGACVAVGDAGTLLQPGNHGTTFGGNAVSTAAALAVIATIESDDLLAHVTTIGDQLRRGLGDHPLVADVTGRGLLVGVVLRQPLAAEAQKAAMASGLILNNATPDRLRLAPPLILSETEAAHAVTVLRDVLDQVSA